MYDIHKVYTMLNDVRLKEIALSRDKKRLDRRLSASSSSTSSNLMRYESIYSSDTSEPDTDM